INILGLNIIVGCEFISVNDKHPGVSIRQKSLGQINIAGMHGLMSPIEGISRDDSLFNRLPRRITAFEPKNIQIESPPMSLNDSSIPMLLRMGSPLVMGGASALSGHYMMLLSMVLFPFLTQKYTDKQRKEYEDRRLVKYREYLDIKRSEIKKEKEYEEAVLRKNYPDLNKVLSYPADGEHLWERRKTDDDFLKIRIGTGGIPLHAEIEYPVERFNLEEDELEKEMYELATAPVTLDNAPILVDFIENFVCSVAGKKKQAIAFAKRLLMSLAVLNSYDEVKIIILAEPDVLLDEEIEFVKYIPHVWDDQRSMRYIAAEPGEAYQIGEHVKQEIEEDIEKPRELKSILKTRPYYVVFAFSKKLFDSMEILKDVIQQENSVGVSVITLFEDIPKECSLLFNINESGYNSITHLKEISRADDHFRFDSYDPVSAAKGMKTVANTKLKTVSQAYSLPKSLSFLEMYRAGRVEHLNILKRWAENNPIKSLAAPIGITTDGSLFYLDLHQKYQGPHGLVAGTTGSGKSEFLITYILSMAINYRPEEVAFVLIDYKGGGLAGAFDDPAKGIHLPHLVGTITNLDGAAIERSLASIESELMRRQRIFNEAKSVSDEGTMDIYSYQRLFRANKVSEPVPHLFIISDEFAELKQQQPEFMDKLISAARIGRSLGVHLILATQKPTGVVNDQIRSNTKFRVCLKVQDKNDSMDMLKRPEAAEIKETGRFYLQVGYNEFFALGQSGWSGAPYEPQDEVVIHRDDSIRVVDALGQTISSVKPVVQKSAAAGTHLTAIVKVLTEIAKAENISLRQLWKPALRKHIDISEVIEAQDTGSFFEMPLGMLDDPQNQEQFIINYDFEKSQHLLVSGLASSGKTQMLQTMIYYMAEHHTPEDVQFFILDYSSRLLKQFGKLQHCSAALIEEDFDKIGLFFDLIYKTITDRKALFSEIGVDNYSTARKIVKLPLILVFIDNFSGLTADKVAEKYAFNLHKYLKEGLNYGVKFIISCSHLNDLTSRVKQEIGDRICLAMKDKYEFSDGLNCKVTYVPPDYPGRGLYNYGGRALEFHSAIFHAHEDDMQRIADITEEIDRIHNKYIEHRKAPRLPATNLNVTYSEFTEQFAPGRIPLGFSKQTKKPVALPFRQFSLLSVYQGNSDGVIPLFDNLLLVARNENMNVWAFACRNDSYLSKTDFSERGYGPDCRIIECSSEILSEYWQIVTNEVVKRKELRQEYCDKNNLDINTEEGKEKCFKYMSQNTEPLLLLIEKHSDFCQYVDDISTMVYDKIFRVLDLLNIYTISFFYPEDSEEVRNKILYSGFNIDGITMLFGGRLDKQSMLLLNEENDESLHKTGPFSECIMQYRSQLYPLVMPCGEIAEDEKDSDSQNIFL
ncbi:MAG: type VII secretion protein EssC, partial [Mogibacterium sp.]|nr:type VII secretion protein EssC [Mogibacterium sp.]